MTSKNDRKRLTKAHRRRLGRMLRKFRLKKVSSYTREDMLEMLSSGSVGELSGISIIRPAD